MLLSILLTGMLFVAPLAIANAASVNIIPGNACQGEAASSSVCQANNTDPITGTGGLLFKVTNIIAWFGGIIAVIMIVYAGFVYVTSGGEQGKIKSAKDIILYAVIGLVIIVVARTIVVFVINKL